MVNRVSLRNQFRSPEDDSEFEIFDGEDFIKFNIIDINVERREITVAVTDRGRISVITYDLMQDGCRSYFEYGSPYTQIDIDLEDEQ